MVMSLVQKRMDKPVADKIPGSYYVSVTQI